MSCFYLLKYWCHESYCNGKINFAYFYKVGKWNNIDIKIKLLKYISKYIVSIVQNIYKVLHIYSHSCFVVLMFHSYFLLWLTIWIISSLRCQHSNFDIKEISCFRHKTIFLRFFYFSWQYINCNNINFMVEYWISILPILHVFVFHWR